MAPVSAIRYPFIHSRNDLDRFLLYFGLQMKPIECHDMPVTGLAFQPPLPSPSEEIGIYDYLCIYMCHRHVHII
jgi:hypothetical protein